MGWEIWVLGGCWKGWGIWVSGRLLEEVRYLGVGEAAGGVGKSRGGGAGNGMMRRSTWNTESSTRNQGEEPFDTWRPQMSCCT